MNIEHLRTALHLISFLAQFCLLSDEREYIEDNHSTVKWFLGI